MLQDLIVLSYYISLNTKQERMTKQRKWFENVEKSGEAEKRWQANFNLLAFAG